MATTTAQNLVIQTALGPIATGTRSSVVSIRFVGSLLLSEELEPGQLHATGDLPDDDCYRLEGRKHVVVWFTAMPEASGDGEQG